MTYTEMIGLSAAITDAGEPPEIEAAVRTVRPALARALLERNIDNRRRSPDVERLYADRMRRGVWVDGTPIYIARDGRLIDGQTRLHAQISADVDVTYVIVTNCPPELQHWLDQQRRRTNAQQLSRLRDVKNTTLMSSTINLCARDEAGITGQEIFSTNATAGKPKGFPDGDQQIDFYDRWESELETAVRLASQVRGTLLLPVSVLAYVAWKILQVAPLEDLESFYDAIKTGDNLGKGDPAKVFRERHLRPPREANVSAPRTKIDRYYQAGELIKAWNLWRMGKTATGAAIVHRTGGKFPEIQA